MDEPRIFGISGDAFKDEVFLEWLLSNQTDGETDALYQDLLQQSFDVADGMGMSKQAVMIHQYANRQFDNDNFLEYKMS